MGLSGILHCGAMIDLLDQLAASRKARDRGLGAGGGLKQLPLSGWAI